MGTTYAFSLGPCLSAEGLSSVVVPSSVAMRVRRVRVIEDGGMGDGWKYEAKLLKALLTTKTEAPLEFARW